MPKQGNWGNWAVIGGRHTLEPGVEKASLVHYEKSEAQRQKEAATQSEKKKYALPWEKDLYDPRESQSRPVQSKKRETKKAERKKRTHFNSECS